ncbi:alpha-amylase family glycosyl hydrolase [Ileibacterium valens]|uniref:alpha-amylase family glycosyl hydrolase n=1 Tax=Ileibacterium valens TaxID=1862668 RepID=UPI0025731055|nr:alpha-amylase family glycosyl hydrolase [Ileibacterium valens]
MRKIIQALAAAALLISVAGCSSVNSEKTTALSLMEEINNKNVYFADPNARLWYEINTKYFMDSNGDGKGDLKGVIDALPYLSDDDPSLAEKDLNMTGVYLTDIISEDSAGSVLDYFKLNSEVGNEEDLTELTQKGNELDIPVMINLDLSSCSVKSPYFEDVLKHANELGKEAALTDLNSEYAQMFSITDEQPNSNWIPLGHSPFFYLGFNGTDAPNFSQDSEAFRTMVRKVIEHYLSLGVQGFYIEDMNAFYSNSKEKNAEFSSWLVNTVTELNPNAIVVFSTANLESDLSSVDGWIALSKNAGVEGDLAKAATGTISAKELGDLIEQSNQKIAYPATYVNTPENTLDLLKTEKKANTFKMLMALQMLSSGQIFITAGDEIGLPSNEFDLVSEALSPVLMEASSENAKKNSDSKDQQSDPDKKSQDQMAEIRDQLTFGSFSEQKEDGNSVLNFILQAILLRDSYTAISSGKTEVVNDLNTEDILVLKKSVENSEVMVIYNFGDTEQKVNVENMTLSGLPVEIGGVLLTSDQSVHMENGQLLMPAQSVCVLK